MDALRVIGAALLIAQATAACGQAASSGDMRMLIAPNAAIDAPTYEQYQRCLARIPLNQDLKAVTVAREACREKALQHAYRVPPPATIQTDSGVRKVPTVQDRTGYQSRQLERLRQ